MSRRAVDSIAAYAGAHVYLPALMFSAGADRPDQQHPGPHHRAARAGAPTPRASCSSSHRTCSSTIPACPARGHPVGSSSASPASPTRAGSQSACSCTDRRSPAGRRSWCWSAFLSGNIMLSLGVPRRIHRPARAGEFCARAVPGLRRELRVNGSAGGTGNERRRATALLVAFVVGNVSAAAARGETGQDASAPAALAPVRPGAAARHRPALAAVRFMVWGEMHSATCSASPTRRTRCSSRWSMVLGPAVRRGCHAGEGGRIDARDLLASCCAWSAIRIEVPDPVISWIALALCSLCTVGAQLSFKAYHFAAPRMLPWMALVLFAAAAPSTMLAVRGFGVGGSTSPRVIDLCGGPVVRHLACSGERIGKLLKRSG